jgi:hypothetical protein
MYVSERDTLDVVLSGLKACRETALSLDDDLLMYLIELTIIRAKEMGWEPSSALQPPNHDAASESFD